MLKNCLYIVNLLAAITLTFDDGYDSHYESALPLLEAYGFHATFYITSSLLGEPGYLTPAQLIDLFERGHEIASHGVTHRDLRGLSLHQVAEELLGSQRTLEAFLHTPVTSFAPPFGIANPLVFHFLKSHYASNRTIRPGLNCEEQCNRWLILSHVVFHTTLLAQVEQWLDQAISEEKWLVLVYHRISDSTGIVDVSAAVLESHLQAIQRRNIAVKPMRAIIESRSDSQRPRQRSSP